MFPIVEARLSNLSVRLLVLGALVLALAALVRPQHAAATPSRIDLVEQIDTYRAATWRWQRLMGAPRTPSRFTERSTESRAYREWTRDLWRKRALAAQHRAKNPPHRNQWLCIHRYEQNPTQGWATRTGNGYYGGLQMDISFQRSYGGFLLARKGTADNWTALEQMWVAERAHRSGRGFHPWPNTARYCGLI